MKGFEFATTPSGVTVLLSADGERRFWARLKWDVYAREQAFVLMRDESECPEDLRELYRTWKKEQAVPAIEVK